MRATRANAVQTPRMHYMRNVLTHRPPSRLRASAARRAASPVTRPRAPTPCRHLEPPPLSLPASLAAGSVKEHRTGGCSGRFQRTVDTPPPAMNDAAHGEHEGLTIVSSRPFGTGPARRHPMAGPPPSVHNKRGRRRLARGSPSCVAASIMGRSGRVRARRGCCSAGARRRPSWCSQAPASRCIRCGEK